MQIISAYDIIDVSSLGKRDSWWTSTNVGLKPQVDGQALTSVQFNIKIGGMAMNLTSYHTHCNYCDGLGKMEEYVKSAIDKGMKSIGFSSHAPINKDIDWVMKEEDLPKYINDVNSLKTKYKGVIDIYLGLEIDYIREINHNPSLDIFKELNLDYKIGAVHMAQGKDGRLIGYDGPICEFEEILNSLFNGKAQDMVEDFYKRVRELVSYDIDILAHLDLIKKLNAGNKYFDEDAKWYKSEIIKTLDLIKEKDIIVETNSGGIARGFRTDLYPADWIIEEMFKRNIKITINSDAHNCKNVDFYYKEARYILMGIGYREKYILKNGEWKAELL